MGTFKVTVGLAHPMHRVFQDCVAIVDTGATHSVIPASLLKDLGVESCETAMVALADNKTVELPLGEARFRLPDGRERTTTVLFGDEGIFLLGATTLELFGVVPDTTHRRLVPDRLLMVGMRAAGSGGVIQETLE